MEWHTWCHHWAILWTLKGTQYSITQAHQKVSLESFCTKRHPLLLQRQQPLFPYTNAGTFCRANACHSLKSGLFVKALQRNSLKSPLDHSFGILRSVSPSVRPFLVFLDPGDCDRRRPLTSLAERAVSNYQRTGSAE